MSCDADGEDGAAKVWSRNGMLRTTLVQSGMPTIPAQCMYGLNNQPRKAVHVLQHDMVLYELLCRHAYYYYAKGKTVACVANAVRG